MGKLDEASFVISVAAKVAGMHPQTLRQYDRLGLVSPSRTRGQGRRYSAEDIAALREVQRLSKEEGISLAGIREIIRLRAELKRVQSDLSRVVTELERLRDEADSRRSHRVFTAGPTGDVVLVPFGTRRRARAVPASVSQSIVLAPRRALLALPSGRTKR